jgi:hypothetical protein
MNNAQQNQLAYARNLQLARAQASRSNPSVGACAPSPWDASQSYGTGQFGLQYSPNMGFMPSLPQNAPNVQNPLLVNPFQVIQQNYSPLGTRTTIAIGGVVTQIDIAPNTGLFYIAGVRSCNDCDEVDIIRVISGGADVARNAGTFDAAAYNTIECFCPVDWGVITHNQPLQIQAMPVGTPSAAPVLNWTLFGTQQQSWNSAYPGIIPATMGGFNQGV